MKSVAKSVNVSSVRKVKSTNLKSSGLNGAIAPFRNGFDPLRFSDNVDFSTLKRYREAELTHGRVAMLASVGFLVGEAVEGHGPFFESQVTGPAINHFQQVPLPFWFALGSAIAFAESTRIQKGWASPFDAPQLWLLKEDYSPGDLGVNPLKLGGTDEAFERTQNQELSNGRLAMLAITGMVIQELVFGVNVIPADDAFLIEGQAGVIELETSCKNSPDEAKCADRFVKSLESSQKTKITDFLASENIKP